MILSICASEIDETSFNVWNIISTQTYTDSGIDLSTVTDATLYFGKVNGDEDDEVSVTLTPAQFQYLFATGGLTIHFAAFQETLINGYSYFPDYMYTVRIEYVYPADGETYTASATMGFKARIQHIIYQQMLQSEWKKELSCTCSCESYSTTLRKWNYLMMMEIAANLCLINEYLNILGSLYKLTNTEYEFAS